MAVPVGCDDAVGDPLAEESRQIGAEIDLDAMAFDLGVSLGHGAPVDVIHNLLAAVAEGVEPSAEDLLGGGEHDILDRGGQGCFAALARREPVVNLGEDGGGRNHAANVERRAVVSLGLRRTLDGLPNALQLALLVESLEVLRFQHHILSR